MIGGMRSLSSAFYRGAVQVGNHAFIEFTGFLNEYIKLCEQSLSGGLDFTEANTHVGKPLVMYGFNAAYLGEKFGCVFETSFDTPEKVRQFCASAFGSVSKFPRCGECGGQVELQAKSGRTREFVPGVHLPIPDDFEIPTCVKCEETYMSPEVSGPLDSILGGLFMTRLPRVGGRYVYRGTLRDAAFTVAEVDSNTGAIYLDPDTLNEARLALLFEYKDRDGNTKTSTDYAWIEKRKQFAVNFEWDAWKFKTTPLIAYVGNRPQDE